MRRDDCAFPVVEERTTNDLIIKVAAPGMSKYDYAVIHMAAALLSLNDDSEWPPETFGKAAHRFAKELFEND